MLAPYPVMDYVAAHECAHLIEANHSPRFWAVVKDLVGDHRPHRAWLRANGSETCTPSDEVEVLAGARRLTLAPT